jgi:hypothetical protein
MVFWSYWPALAAISRGRLHLAGAVAQLGERLVRNEEVRGSTPLGSTIRQSSDHPVDACSADTSVVPNQ